jgi:hypothetical protein
MKEFLQEYNARCAVDTTIQIIIAADVAKESTNKKQIERMTDPMQNNPGRFRKTALC